MKTYTNLNAFKIGLLFFACSITTTIQANSSDNVDSVKNKGRQLTINLLSPVIYYTPRFQVGYQKRINDRWQWGVEIGYGSRQIIPNRYKTSNPYMGSKYSSWSVEPEIIYSYNKRKKDERYFSLELFYIHHKDHFDNIIKDYKQERLLYTNSFNHDLVYDKADYLRKKIGLNFKYGLRFQVLKKIGFDLSSGFGIKFRNVKYTNFFNPIVIEEPLHGYGSDVVPQTGHRNYIKEDGNIVRLNFIIDFKFYVMLK